MNILSEYLDQQNKECLINFATSDKVMLIIGKGESGKSSLLKQLFSNSNGTIKVFQGGAPVSSRNEILQDITYEMKKYPEEMSKHIFLDEFDDEESLKRIFNTFIYTNSKVVISSKMSLSSFSKYEGKFSHMDLTCKKIFNKIKNQISIPQELINDLCKLELGEWVYIENRIKESITKEDIYSAISHRHLELEKKNNCKQSMCVINSPIHTILKFYKY